MASDVATTGEVRVSIGVGELPSVIDSVKEGEVVSMFTWDSARHTSKNKAIQDFIVDKGIEVE